MPHTNRDNYKAKWLNALASKGVDPHAKVDTDVEVIRGAQAVAANATVEARLQLENLRDMALAGIELQETLDDARQIGPLKAPVVLDDADGKLTKLPASIIIRRCRDLMRLASGRIGILCAHQEMQEENMTRLLDAVKELSGRNSLLQSQLIETYHIGHSPTPDEGHELVATAGSSKQYRRYGIVYTNVDTDNFLESLGVGPKRGAEQSSDEEEDDDDDAGPSKRALATTRAGQGTKRANGTGFLDEL